VIPDREPLVRNRQEEVEPNTSGQGRYDAGDPLAGGRECDHDEYQRERSIRVLETSAERDQHGADGGRSDERRDGKKPCSSQEPLGHHPHLELLFS
jgi:hypothetical protein